MKRFVIASLFGLMSLSAAHAQGIESILGKRLPAFRTAKRVLTKATDGAATFPTDAVWARESYHARRGEFYNLELIRIRRWKTGSYYGIWGTNPFHVRAISKTRLLLEQDSSDGINNEILILDKKPGGILIQYAPSRKPGSRFAKSLESAGLSVAKNIIRSDRASLFRFLRSYKFSRREIGRRFRRPTNEEMKQVWTVAQLDSWYKRNLKRHSQTAMRMDHFKELGQLGIGRKFMKEIANSGVDHIQYFALDKVTFGPGKSNLERLAKNAKKNLMRIDQKIDERMAELGKRIGSETLVEGDGRRPAPGDAVKFHCVMTDVSGRKLADSRKRGQPTQVAIAGDCPDGIAYALCSTRMGGKSRFTIPAELAYGDKRGDVTFEVEIVQFVFAPRDKPPLKSGISGYELSSLDMKETSSKLLYSDMRVGQGPEPERGQRIVIKKSSWSATGTPLDQAETRTIELGSNDNPAGLNEALATMRPGGVRMICMPKELAYQTDSRRGMAIRMMISLLRVEQ